MAPKPKTYPARLGPPPQLNSLKHIPVVQQKFANKVQPKLREVLMTHVKILSRWFHNNMSWKKILLFWMVILIASKMVLLMLTNQFFTMMSLVSLEVSDLKYFSSVENGQIFSVSISDHSRSHCLKLPDKFFKIKSETRNLSESGGDFY